MRKIEYNELSTINNIDTALLLTIKEHYGITINGKRHDSAKPLCSALWCFSNGSLYVPGTNGQWGDIPETALEAIYVFDSSSQKYDFNWVSSLVNGEIEFRMPNKGLTTRYFHSPLFKSSHEDDLGYGTKIRIWIEFDIIGLQNTNFSQYFKGNPSEVQIDMGCTFDVIVAAMSLQLPNWAKFTDYEVTSREVIVTTVGRSTETLPDLSDRVSISNDGEVTLK